MNIRKSPSPNAGFTLMEVTISIAVFSILGVGLTQGLKIADSTQESVSAESGQNRKVRDSVMLLRDELKACQNSSIEVTTSPNGNHQLMFQVPVDSGGGTGWGVYDRKLGSKSEDWNRVGWKLCYVVQANNQGESSLFRQILDGAGNLQREAEIIGHVLANGQPEGPGFSVNATGDVWEITLRTKTGEGQATRTETFQIQTRN